MLGEGAELAAQQMVGVIVEFLLPLGNEGLPLLVSDPLGGRKLSSLTRAGYTHGGGYGVG